MSQDASIDSPHTRPRAGSPGVPPIVGSDAARTRKLYLEHKRIELLAPVKEVVDVASQLLEEPKIQECEPVRDDLIVVRDHATELVRKVEACLEPAPGCDEAAGAVPLSPQAIKHKLYGLLMIICGFGEELSQNAEEYHLDAFVPDFDRIEALGSSSIDLVAAVAAHLDGSAEPAGDTPEFRHFQGLLADLSESRPVGAVSPGRILVVDDNPNARKLLCHALARFGHEAIDAPDGPAALSAVNADPARFDLVLLDLVMTREASGVDVLRRLKGNPKTAGIPVIMVSGLDERSGIARCIALGAEDYLQKPCDRLLLRARVGASIERKRLRDRAEAERRRYNAVLREILPDRVVKDLARGRAVQPRRYEKVAVLFADIVGFTRFCDARPPEAVIEDLSDLFCAWEAIAETHGVQKIKTIGDAFMAAAGLPDAHEDAVLDCARCGLEMILSTRRIQSRLDLRVGIHVGPVVAGILGKRQYLYDIWGDTVNTASRLESHGQAGCVNLSVEAWARVAPHFHGEWTSSRSIKGKEGDGPVDFIHLDPARIVEQP